MSNGAQGKGEALDKRIDRYLRETDADVVLHYVEKSTFDTAGLPAERTYIPIGDGLYTGSTIYYIRDFSKVMSSLGKIREMRK